MNNLNRIFDSIKRLIMYHELAHIFVKYLIFAYSFSLLNIAVNSNPVQDDYNKRIR